MIGKLSIIAFWQSGLNPQISYKVIELIQTEAEAYSVLVGYDSAEAIFLVTCDARIPIWDYLPNTIDDYNYPYITCRVPWKGKEPLILSDFIGSFFNGMREFFVDEGCSVSDEEHQVFISGAIKRIEHEIKNKPEVYKYNDPLYYLRSKIRS